MNCIDTACYGNQFGGKHHRPRSNVSAFLKKKKIQKEVAHWKSVYEYLKENKALHSIVIIKNPYSWHSSIKRYINNKGQTLDFNAVYNRYNMLYTAFKDFHYSPQSWGEHFGKVVIVKYENLLRNPKKHLGIICSKLEVPLQKSIKVPNKVDMSPRFVPEKRKFYLRNDTFGLPPKTVQAINDIIDWDLMSFYGYKRIDV
jgi:hypothetical protein